MNITELASPIRLYWDFGPAGPIDAAVCRRIAREIAENKILSLQMTETADRISPSCLAVLDELRNDMIALSLVASQSALDASAIDILRTSPVKVLFITASSHDELEPALKIIKGSPATPATGLSFPVSRNNYRLLPDVLSFCVAHRIGHLLLPMQRLMTDEACFSISRIEREELTAEIDLVEKPSWLKIIIHDPFLWRAFFPKVQFPNGGCQAANTMLYLSPVLEVYPCPVLPISIGNLGSTSLREIIRSDRKKGLRNTITNRPRECLSCAESDQCKGGCRGRAYSLTGSLDAYDPACK